MKKVILSVFLVVACCAAFWGCTKDTPYITTNNPSMTADIGTFKFVSSAVRPATIDTQIADTSTTLVITGYTSDRANPYDKIVLYVANYKGVTGTYSIVQGQASAVYYHNGRVGVALGGIVAIKSVSSTLITGYFNFNTDDGVRLENGLYSVGTP
jgi:hypothetical protein